MTRSNFTTLRLVMPQWQGGDEPAYRLGAGVLAALLPDAAGPVETITVAPGTGETAPLQEGVKYRDTLLAQLDAARDAIRRHDPEAIVTVGGDCLADLAPIAHLQEKYGDDLAVIWVDTHPDIMTPAEFSHAHAHVLAMLMGDGDAAFAERVPVKIKPEQVLYVGVHGMSDHEAEYVGSRGMSVLSPRDLGAGYGPVIDWLKANGASKVAVHFDFDVLSPEGRDDLLFNKPDLPEGAFDGIAQGCMKLPQVIELLRAVDRQAPVVGLAITEYLPWPLVKLAQQLSDLPLIGRD